MGMEIVSEFSRLSLSICQTKPWPWKTMTTNGATQWQRYAYSATRAELQRKAKDEINWKKLNLILIFFFL